MSSVYRTSDRFTEKKCSMIHHKYFNNESCREKTCFRGFRSGPKQNAPLIFVVEVYLFCKALIFMIHASTRTCLVGIVMNGKL